MANKIENIISKDNLTQKEIDMRRAKEILSKKEYDAWAESYYSPRVGMKIGPDDWRDVQKRLIFDRVNNRQVPIRKQEDGYDVMSEFGEEDDGEAKTEAGEGEKSGDNEDVHGGEEGVAINNEDEDRRSGDEEKISRTKGGIIGTHEDGAVDSGNETLNAQVTPGFEERGPKSLDRRRLMKIAGAAVLALFVGKGLKMFVTDDHAVEEKKVEEEKPTVEQTQIDEGNFQAIEEIINFDQPGKIKFRLENVERLKNSWKKKYQEDPRLTESLTDAFYAMGEWKDHLVEEFEKVGFSRQNAEKYIYLAIPESHWQLNARSFTGAVGPYQFMPKTARSFGLNSGEYEDEDKNIDERKDPIKSARACAKHLMDIYHKTGDMDVSLSGYNGSFVWKYIENGGRNYKGFVKFLETRVNELRERMKTIDSVEHMVRKKELFPQIAKKYGCSAQELAHTNNIVDYDNIKIGQRLTIPVTDNNRKIVYNIKVRGFAENMVYPAKFQAVDELLDEKFVTKEKAGVKFKEMTVKSQFQATHHVKKGDGMWRLSLNYGVSQEEILIANQMNAKDLKIGQVLKIPTKKQVNTLSRIAKRYNIDITRLKGLNPSVLDADEIIPDGYNIRY